jgi:glutamyl-tRNA synthetase
MPQFAHLPLLLKPDGNGKLSKRDGDRLGFPVFPLEFHNEKEGTVSRGYREDGYFPEAVINFLALLGWHSSGDQEIYSMEELIREFSLDRVSKSGAKFDYEKGKWFNHQYLIRKTDEELAGLFRPIVEERLREKNLLETAAAQHALQQLPTIVGLMKERVNFVSELWEQADFFFAAPKEFDEKSVQKRWKADSPRQMEELAVVLESTEDWSAESLDKVVMGWIAEKEYGVGIVMNAFRICLVGAARGPHIWNITDVLGKEETLRRLHQSLTLLTR